MKVLKCKFCKVEPRVINVDDLWYHYCPKCMHHGKYYCCGTTKIKSAQQWNAINQVIAGVVYDTDKPRRFYV